MRSSNFLLIYFLLAAVLLGSVFVWQAFFSAANPEDSQERIFLVERGQSLYQISEDLEGQGFIKNKNFFIIWVLFKRKSNKLVAGDYLLSPSMNIVEIEGKLTRGESLLVKITVPEGFTIGQIEKRIKEVLGDGYSQKEGFGSIEGYKAERYKKDFRFLEGLPDKANLEGFLFPDTYEVRPSITSEEFVLEMLSNFDKKLTNPLREEIERQQKTVFEVVTLASLIEKEVKDYEDRQLVSGILWKRLESGIPLQVDATITYITGKKTTKVSREETQVDSPYNTYKYRGLPLGPICNPGIESIRAAIFPQKSNFWYYLSTPEGKTLYSQTLEEHNIKKAKHLQ